MKDFHYSDKTSFFVNLLETERSVPIHIENLQIFAREIFKVNRDLELTIFGELFKKGGVQYNLLCFSIFCSKCEKYFSWNREFFYLGPKIWDLVAENLVLYYFDLLTTLLLY